jgi:dienelactone hydrolase
MTRNAASLGRSTFIITLALLAACSSESEPSPSGSGGQTAGGSTATGGKSVGTGGTTGGAATGGAVSATGGAVTGGSVSATGGTATGGSMSAGGRASDGGSGGSTGGSTGNTPGGGSSGAAGSPGGAGGAAVAGAGGVGGGVGGGAGGSPLAPVTDYAAPGPFKTSTQAGTGPDGTYTVIRPATLGESGFLHAPVTFGPGTGMEVSQLSGLLQRIASHGFVIVARQLTGGPGDPVTLMRMTAGLDWLIAQNSVAGSVFEGKLDVKRAVAMGYSVGGTGAVEVGAHQAIATVVSIHGHQAKAALHSPLLLIGGTDDVMGDDRSWLAPTYDDSQVQTFFGTVIGANHGYIQGTVNGVPGGVETPAMIAWLRYWIYNDQGAKKYFYGDDCVMCREPWTDPKRKNWQ